MLAEDKICQGSYGSLDAVETRIELFEAMGIAGAGDGVGGALEGL